MTTKTDWTMLASEEDASVNFHRATPDGGMLECRFVQRDPSYAIAYLSSHSGCRHACRFCHLTQTGQTSFAEATIADLTEQFDTVTGYMKQAGIAPPKLHVNFMARGDAMSSKAITGSFDAFARHATDAFDGEIVFNISTIFPTDAEDVDLTSAFGDWPVTFYWSLYALCPKFRRRWLPRASAPVPVSHRLLSWQRMTGREVVIHGAFIEGENAKPELVENLASWIRHTGLDARFNLVRYNPANERSGREPDEATLAKIMERIEPAMTRPGSRIVPRVGLDVAASCGMFLSA